LTFLVGWGFDLAIGAQFLSHAYSHEWLLGHSAPSRNSAPGALDENSRRA
jgi:hypothetical protein